MQRLKGLTTGSLPTFIDAGNNFGSAEIEEDNFLHQLNSIGKKIVFLGDDTWTHLFPNSFYQSYPFDSFNVRDLHSVDQGVIEHLFPLLENHSSNASEWEIIIAHFLGVDHCGHTFGPNHPEMAFKLTQMNSIIERVLSSLQNDTILFIFGDHGMTKDGDHGGDSDAEVQSALFVYSKSPFLSSSSSFSFSKDSDPFSISQTDFVPTLSLLLGAP
eukprot:Sdes_comp23879_c0_seq1m22009